MATPSREIFRCNGGWPSNLLTPPLERPPVLLAGVSVSGTAAEKDADSPVQTGRSLDPHSREVPFQASYTPLCFGGAGFHDGSQ